MMEGNDYSKNANSDDDYDDLLVRAVLDGNVLGVLELLLRGNANVNAKDSEINDSSPLHVACEGYHDDTMDIAKLLIDFGADVHARDKYNVTPLHKAVENSDQWQISKFLIWNGANVNAKDVSGWTPLHCACSAGHLDAAKYLLENGAWMNARNSCGTTPLDEAKSKLQRQPRSEHPMAMEVINFLTENGAH